MASNLIEMALSSRDFYKAFSFQCLFSGQVVAFRTHSEPENDVRLAWRSCIIHRKRTKGGLSSD